MTTGWRENVWDILAEGNKCTVENVMKRKKEKMSETVGDALPNGSKESRVVEIIKASI